MNKKTLAKIYKVAGAIGLTAGAAALVMGGCNGIMAKSFNDAITEHYEKARETIKKDYADIESYLEGGPLDPENEIPYLTAKLERYDEILKLSKEEYAKKVEPEDFEIYEEQRKNAIFELGAGVVITSASVGAFVASSVNEKKYKEELPPIPEESYYL